MIFSFFAKSRKDTIQSKVISEDKFLEINFRYPGIVHSGKNKFLITHPDEIISSYSDFIHQNKIMCGLRSDFFNDMAMPAIKNYANFVHLLPATFADYYNAPGGLFKFGLDVAFRSLESAIDKIHLFNKENQEINHSQKILLATFLSGLFSHLYLAITSISILSEDGKVWPSSTIPFYTWSQKIDSGNFKVIWNCSDLALNYTNYVSIIFALNRVIPVNCINYFQEDGGQILDCIISTLLRIHSSNNAIEKSVRSAEVYVVRKDIDYQRSK